MKRAGRGAAAAAAVHRIQRPSRRLSDVGGSCGVAVCGACSRGFWMSTLGDTGGFGSP